MRVFIENKEKADRTILQKAQQTFWYNASYMLFYSAIVFNQKEYADALPVVEQAARLQPSSYLFSELGECYYQVGNNEQAEQAFRKAAEMTPGYVTPHYKLFSFFRQSGQLEKAAAIAQYLLDAIYKQYGSNAIFTRQEAKDFLEMYKVSVAQHQEGGKMIGN